MGKTALNRVPQILWLYWVIKIASTTLGETAADMFSMTFHLGYSETILFFIGLFLIFLIQKIFLGKYEPISYWFVFTASAIAGTAISDFIDRTLKLGYALGSLTLVILLILTLFLWYLKTKSISVENIYSNKAEIYYWLAFLVANTLGTAAGDFLADDLQIGFLQSAIFISLLLILILSAHFFTKVSGIFLFWVAFVLTRPFGATFGDLLTKSGDQGGLGVGTIWTSSIFFFVLVIAVFAEVKAEKKRNCSP